jgi:transcriptional regulator with XRE-family HTH domain
MDEVKRKRLEELGYWVGDYGDFLGLTEAERQHVELRIALCAGIRRLRAAKGRTQKTLGKMIGSTQSRVAKVESGTTIDVSLDLMFRAFFALGGTMEDLVSPKATQPATPEVKADKLEPKPKAKRLARQGGGRT